LETSTRCYSEALSKNTIKMMTRMTTLASASALHPNNQTEDSLPLIRVDHLYIRTCRRWIRDWGCKPHHNNTLIRMRRAGVRQDRQQPLKVCSIRLRLLPEVDTIDFPSSIDFLQKVWHPLILCITFSFRIFFCRYLDTLTA